MLTPDEIATEIYPVQAILLRIHVPIQQARIISFKAAGAYYGI